MLNLIKTKEKNIKLREKRIQKQFLFKGVSYCPYCGKIIEGRVMIKNGYSYLERNCIFCKEFSSILLGKGKFFKSPKRMPSYWPKWNLKVEEDYGDVDINNVVNYRKIPCVVIKLTTECNSSCKICGIQNITPSLNRDKNYILEKLENFKNQEIVLCGGEPTVKEDLSEIMKMVKSSGNIPAITTNGLKLANRKYLKQLIKNGLKHIYFSFDGFNPEIYKEIRGGREEYFLKLRALENISREKVSLSLFSTVIKEVNEQEIPKIIEFCKNNNYISDVWFKPLYLDRKEQFGGFDKTNLMSNSEIREIITNHLQIDKDYFKVWDEFKFNLAKFLDKKFNWIKIPVFDEGKIYFYRKNGLLVPLLETKELKNLNKSIKKDKIKDFIKPKYLWWFLKFLSKGFLQGKIEEIIFRKGAIFRIAQNQCGVVKDKILIEDEPVVLFPYRVIPLRMKEPDARY